MVALHHQWLNGLHQGLTISWILDVTVTMFESKFEGMAFGLYQTFYNVDHKRVTIKL